MEGAAEGGNDVARSRSHAHKLCRLLSQHICRTRKQPVSNRCDVYQLTRAIETAASPRSKHMARVTSSACRNIVGNSSQTFGYTETRLHLNKPKQHMANSFGAQCDFLPPQFSLTHA